MPAASRRRATPSSIADFARRYGVSPAAVHDWGRRGLLRITRLGPRLLRILPPDERHWLQARRQETAAEVERQQALDAAAEARRQQAAAARAEARRQQAVANQAQRQQTAAARAEVQRQRRAEAQVLRQQAAAARALTQGQRDTAAREQRQREAAARDERRHQLEVEAWTLAHRQWAVDAERRMQAEVAAQARMQAEAKSRLHAEIAQRNERLAARMARAAGPDGLNRLGLSPALRRHLMGLGIYCLRDLEDQPRRPLLPVILGTKGLRELQTVLAENRRLGLDDDGRLYPLVEVA